MWKKFDKIFIFINVHHSTADQINDIKKLLLDQYKFEDLNNVEFIKLDVNNPVIKEIWEYQIKHRMIYNYYNTYMRSDFKGFNDYESSVRHIEIFKRCVISEINKVLIFEPQFLTRKPNVFLNNIDAIPEDYHGIYFLNYKINPLTYNFIKKDNNWSNITYSVFESVKTYAIDKNSMDHIIKNFEMLPKSFHWYLFEHIMPYDNNTKRFAANKVN